MAKRVFIIHGWEGNPRNHWFPWLKKELEKRHFKVRALRMPNPQWPRINEWVAAIAAAVKKPDKDTYFIGHSMGGPAILRYLERRNEQAGGVILVGSWLTLTPMATRTKEEKAIVRPWIKTPLDLNKVKKNARRITAFFADNDPWVPLTNANVFRQKLGAKIITQKGKGHFTKDDGVTKLPAALTEFLKMAR